MWNSTPGNTVMRVRPIVVALGLMLTAGCSQASEAPTAPPTPAVEKASPTPRARPKAGSRVLGKHDITLRGKPACRIDFAYAGHTAEDLFWEEPCAAVTAKMVTQADLTELGKWERLDAFARKFVGALPGGQVLYVEGSVSASIYPIGTTGSTYEVSVAD
jgi:hypothetical protein